VPCRSELGVGGIAPERAPDESALGIFYLLGFRSP